MTKTLKKKKLKIAVLLAGNLRTFEQTAPLLKKYLLDRYDSDVFIYTPNQLEHTAIAWHGKTGGDHESPKAINDEITEKVTKLYNPTTLVISDDYKKIDTEGVWNFPYTLKTGKNYAPLTGPYRMFFNWREVSKLWQAHAKKNKINYDYVVFIRPDVMLLEPMMLEPYEEFFNFNPKTIIFYYGDGVVTENNIIKSLLHYNSDRIIFAKPEAMTIFLNIFNHFDRYFKTAHHLPLPSWARCSFENQQVFYATDQGLFPLFGKINHVLKRMNKKDDQVFIFPDRLNYSSTAIPIRFRRILLRERLRSTRGLIINSIIFVLFIFPFMNRIWFFYKFIKKRIKK